MFSFLPINICNMYFLPSTVGIRVFFFVKGQYLKNRHIIIHMLHVWYIYLHFPLNVSIFHLSCRLGVGIPLQNGPNPTGGGDRLPYENQTFMQVNVQSSHGSYGSCESLENCQVIFFNLWCKAWGTKSLQWGRPLWVRSCLTICPVWMSEVGIKG